MLMATVVGALLQGVHGALHAAGCIWDTAQGAYGELAAQYRGKCVKLNMGITGYDPSMSNGGHTESSRDVPSHGG